MGANKGIRDEGGERGPMGMRSASWHGDQDGIRIVDELKNKGVRKQVEVTFSTLVSKHQGRGSSYERSLMSNAKQQMIETTFCIKGFLPS